MPERMLRTESASPLYAQLMERIQMDIRQGVYPVGDKIPPEHELEERYGVSRVTVRRALQELTSAGLLERKQGKGTFVSQPKPEPLRRGVLGFHDSCREQGRKPSVGKIRVRETEASLKDQRQLHLGPDSRVLEIRRVLKADGDPVVLETCRFSMAYGWLENAGLQGSLYRALQEYGIQPEKSICDLFMRQAEGEEAELLQVEPGTMMMAADCVVYDQKGRPLHTSSQLIRGDRYTLRI